MKIQQGISDNAVLVEIGQRLTRLRLDANLSQAALAREAGVSKRTVERLEGGESIQLGNLLRVLRALGQLDRLETLVPESTPGPVEQLRLKGRKRERARGKTRQPRSKPWTWGDEP